MTVDILLFCFAAFLLWFGADWIVLSASGLARRFGVSELVIGLTVVAAGTSAPEFLVTASAAFRGLADISLSNVVGSNIFNLGFILGIMAMIRPLPSSRDLVYRDGLALLGVTGLLLALSWWLGELGRGVGLALLGLLGLYLVRLYLQRSRDPGASVPMETPEPEDTAPGAPWLDGIKLAVGFAGIAVGGDLMVTSATGLARELGVSQWVIGVTIVAAGTSLPEMATCLAASARGKGDMLMGNLIGSDFFNFAGVLGLTCLLRPLSVSADALPNLVLLVGMVGLVLVFMRTGWRVGRVEGALLVAINLVRWTRDFLG